ncbi:hypothetical protein CFT12S02225_05865 [Campylobacter fetus subsp. testudinum]|uniref:Uncharacterized protein n=1 Tax=Campylobacter fetus subsp. testudinum TaxID=1507806 RepID=A0AAX0HB59_CAMFE|nr:hypothetical protein [Campylobacter fetus]OCR90561.1 hypothetical protein CFT12S02225_05865 [Campylobacter fetus subsp. testudinum]OCR92909.1 hypothetical protein CFT12S02842_08885 [Campylobacter fetus subsp. testudinum]
MPTKKDLTVQIISEIQAILTDFNTKNNLNLAVDTIRATFHKNAYHKTHGNKLEHLKKYVKKYNMKFIKVAKFSSNYQKLKQRLSSEDLANAYILKNLTTKENERIYYINHTKENKDKATLIIYGLKQYHHEAPSKRLINDLMRVINNISSLDLCFDRDKPYNIEAIKENYTIYEPIKYHGNTIYINTLNLANILKICLYNKTIKNNLDFECYRAEATIDVPNLNAKNQSLNRYERLNITLYQSLQEYGLFLNLATKEPTISYSDTYYKRQAILKDKI